MHVRKWNDEAAIVNFQLQYLSGKSVKKKIEQS